MKHSIYSRLFSIKIHTKTWQRDSHGLFDYEVSDAKITNIVTQNSGLLSRDKQEIKLMDIEINETLKKHSEDETDLANIYQENNKYFIDNPLGKDHPINNTTLTDLQEKIWHVLSNSKSNANQLENYQYNKPLRKNDILKLGRIKFLVLDINVINKKTEESEQTFKLYKEVE